MNRPEKEEKLSIRHVHIICMDTYDGMYTPYKLPLGIPCGWQRVIAIKKR